MIALSREFLQLASLILVLCVLSACASEDTTSPKAHGVLHLDPRLESGDSSAVALAGALQVVKAWDLTDGAEWPSEWRVVDGTAGKAGDMGTLIVGDEDEQSTRSGWLEYIEPIDVGQVNAIEVDFYIRQDAQVRLTWWDGKRQVDREADFVEGAAEMQTLRFSVGVREEWGQAFNRLCIDLSATSKQRYRLAGIRFLHEGFIMGRSPLDEGGDGGLIRLVETSHRSWPINREAELSCQATVPRGGLLSFHLGRVANGNQASMTARFSVTDGEDELSDDLTLDPGDNEWQAVEMDLSSFGGREVTINFSVESAAERRGGLEADLLIGSPLVVGTLIEDRRPNILLVTMDTTRFDALGFNKTAAVSNGETVVQEQRLLTPFLDGFAAKSYVFDNAWSAGNSTQPSHASILTGISIQDHNLRDNFGTLSDENVTLAEHLRKVGYQTAAITCISPVGIDAGFGQGFDSFYRAGSGGYVNGVTSRDAAVNWIEEWSETGDRPFFLWVHYFDPHTPYIMEQDEIDQFGRDVGHQPEKMLDQGTLPKEMAESKALYFLKDTNSVDYAQFLYHAEVTYMDTMLGEMFASLDEAGIADNTLSVLTADHGEMLGTRGTYFTHVGLYPETVHVPLVLNLPGQKEGRHIPDRVTSRDFVPTVLSQLALVEVGSHRDLVNIAENGSDGNRRLWFEHANKGAVGCRDSQYHFMIVSRNNFEFGVKPGEGDSVVPNLLDRGTAFIYDWTVDPAMQNNLADGNPDLIAEYNSLLRDYRMKALDLETVRRKLGAGEADDLEALGYTGD